MTVRLTLGGLMTMEKGCWLCWLPEVQLSEALTMKLYVPTAVGVPEIMPDPFMANPGGSAPDTKVNVMGGTPPLV